MPEFAQPAWLLGALLAALLVAASLWRRSAGTRRVLAGTLRVLAAASLLIALAGPLADADTRRTEVVFALDVSSSVDREAIAAALDLVNRTRESSLPTGLVVFAADAAVESLVRSGAEPVRELTVQLERSATDIGRAIEIAVGAFAQGAQRRVVLLSDGRENQGDARAAAAVARTLGVEIQTVPLARLAARSEVHVRTLAAPARVRLHEPFRVQAIIHSSGPARAHLVLLRNGVLLHQSDVTLEPGENVYAFVQQAEEPGLHAYEVIVNSDADSEPENNRYPALVEATGPPRVLHVMGAPEAGRYVSAALKAQGLAVDDATAVALPTRLPELAAYDLVILDDVSGFDLSLAKMELLEHYVRDAGGGVLKIGGSRSYAAGGYYGTPVERLLPVDMTVKTEVKIASLSVMFVLDRSGSMGTKVQGEEKLAIAKRAALLSIDLLNRLDRVGVLAFDSGQEWVVSPTEAAMRRPIAEKLHSLQVGGGTDLHAALTEAYRVLRTERAKVKHLIVLSDGITDGAKDFDVLSAQIAADGITISTVALGADADRALMLRLSELGKGRYYHTDDPANVPRIFTTEALTLTRDLVVEGEVVPHRVLGGEPIEGMDAFPALGGYQRTYPKAAAQVLLAAPEDDPLLATWRYGLGKAAAFTSDLSGRWGGQWVQWPEFGRFVAQTARWTMRRSSAEAFVPRVTWQNGRAVMSVDVLDRDERFVNGLVLQASLVAPDHGTQQVRLEQTAPGRYGAQFPLRGAGSYAITLTGHDGARPVGPRTFGLAVPYSSEYLDLGADRELLQEIARLTGGRMLPLSVESEGAITAPMQQAAPRRSQLWQPFVLAALVLLLAEVAVRKVVLPDSWRQRWARRGAQPARTDAEEPEYEALRAAIARERARHLAALADGERLDPNDPAVRARLYMAAGRRR